MKKNFILKKKLDYFTFCDKYNLSKLNHTSHRIYKKYLLK